MMFFVLSHDVQVSECSGKFTLENREISCINYIRKKVGGSKVLVSKD